MREVWREISPHSWSASNGSNLWEGQTVKWEGHFHSPASCFHFIINHHLRSRTVFGGLGRGFSLSLHPKNWGNSSGSVGVCRKQRAESAPQWRSSWAWLWIRKEPSGACPVARWSCRPRPADSPLQMGLQGNSHQLTHWAPPATQYHRSSLSSCYTEQHYNTTKKLHFSSA